MGDNFAYVEPSAKASHRKVNSERVWARNADPAVVAQTAECYICTIYFKHNV